VNQGASSPVLRTEKDGPALSAQTFPVQRINRTDVKKMNILLFWGIPYPPFLIMNFLAVPLLL
jgi:hypothetical protein